MLVTYSVLPLNLLFGICLWASAPLHKGRETWKDVGFIWCPILRIVHPQKGNTKERTVVESGDDRLYTQNNNLGHKPLNGCCKITTLVLNPSTLTLSRCDKNIYFNFC